MKQQGTAFWKSPNTGATNSSGFTALAGGKRHSSLFYGSDRSTADFWTSLIDWDPTIWSRELRYNESSVARIHESRSESSALSVRCIRD
ncbi:MAG: hypothetical protein IH594_13205 [Bacteroidales bacterium]|nr:hypothetical protein [Bacteroidales bacterium]